MRTMVWRIVLLASMVSLMVSGTVAVGMELERLLFGTSPAPDVYGSEAHNARMFALMEEAGITQVVISVNWDMVERQRGVYDWSIFDKRIDMALGHGMKVQSMIVGTPQWALPPGIDDPLHHPQEEFAEDFIRFCQKTAQRYRGKIFGYEFINEPNGYGWRPLGDAVSYTRWLKRCYQGLKQGDPETIVCLGSQEFGGRLDADLSWFEEVYRQGGHGYFDAVAIHPYRWSGDPPIALPAIRQVYDLMCKNGDGDKPVWLNEFAWTVDPNDPTSLETQAQNLIKTYEIIQKPEWKFVSLVSYHVISDWGLPDHLAGLCDIDLNPRPAYFTLKNYPKPPRPAPDPRNGTIRGRVTDSRTGRPVWWAVVYTQGAVYSALTDQEGRYEIKNVLPGTYRITASFYDDYEPQTVVDQTVAGGAATVINFALPDSQPLTDKFADDFEGTPGSCTVDLSPRWKFRIDPDNVGVNEGWQLAGYDDKDWQTIDAGGTGYFGTTWEEQLGINYDGYAWYRKKLLIPGEWKRDRVFVVFGGVDDAYDLYVNGEKVSSFGDPDLPTGPISVWNQLTRSEITSAVHPGETNLLAVRVLDRAEGGGIRYLPALAYSRWFFTSDASPGATKQEILSQPAHAGKGALYGYSDGTTFGHHGNVFVRESGTMLKFWFYLPSDDPKRKVRLEVSAASTDRTGRRRLYPEGAPLNRWTYVSMPVEELSSSLRGRAILTVGITAISDVKGVALVIDEVSLERAPVYSDRP